MKKATAMGRKSHGILRKGKHLQDDGWCMPGGAFCIEKARKSFPAQNPCSQDHTQMVYDRVWGAYYILGMVVHTTTQN